MSEISMGEVPTIKAGQPNLENIIRDVAQKADVESGKPSKESETMLSPIAQKDINSVDAVNQDEFKKHPFNKVRESFRFFTDKGRLALVTATTLVAFGCGTGGPAENPNVSEPNIKTQTPAVSELPTGMPSANIDLNNIQLPPTPEPTSVPTPTIPPTPTPEVSSTSQPSQQEESGKKELIPHSPSITVVDFAPSVQTEGLIQKEFISNEEMIRNMLGDKYIPREQIIQEFGPNYEEKWDEVVGKYPQAIVNRFAYTYFNHGENVASVAKKTLERSGLESTGINILPLQKILDAESITIIKDSVGNPGISLNFDQKRIIELLKNDPNRVINASFQVGEVEAFQETKVDTEVIPKYDDSDPRFKGLDSVTDENIFYPGAVEFSFDGNGWNYLDAEGKKVSPISKEELKKRKLENSEIIEHSKSTELKIHGAYSRDNAMENLPKLFEICSAYPDKFFVFAAGNSGEDFRDAMEALKDKTPKNLLIVGEWIKYKHSMGTYEGPAMEYGKYGQVLGPDIYVDNEGSDNSHGSSFSAPEIAANIDILLRNGFSPEQAKEKILASSDIHSLQLADGTKYTARVFNPQLLKTK